MVDYIRPWVYEKQREALFHSARYGLVEASTKSGKTVGCIIWLLEQALLGKAKRNYWWVAPSTYQAGIAYGRLCNALTQGAFTSNKQDHTVTVMSGGTIWFKTGEEPDKLYGEDVFAAVIDEASRVREEAWVAVRSTLTATKGSVRIIGNVKGRKNWFYRMARRAERGEMSNAHYARLTVNDAVAAGIFDEDEAEDAKSNISVSAYKQLYMAEPANDEGNPFGTDADIDNCILPISTGSAVCWGWDLAKYDDWTVGIALDANGAVCQVKRWRGSWRDTIQRIIHLSGNVPSLVDATGVGDPVLEYLQAEAPGTMEGFKFSSTSKQQLMEGLAVAIQRREISFPKGIVEQEVRSFEYQYTRTGVRYSAPEGEHDDCVCALALAWRNARKAVLRTNLLDRFRQARPRAVLNIFAR